MILTQPNAGNFDPGIFSWEAGSQGDHPDPFSIL